MPGAPGRSHDEVMTTTSPAPSPRSAGPALAAHVVDRLVAEQLLHPAARERALGVVAGALDRRVAGPAPARAGSAVVEVVAYLGTALVLAAGALFGATYWGDLGFGAQVGVLLVAALALGLGGTAAARGHVAAMRERVAPAEPRRRLASTLLAGAALSAGSLAWVLVERVTGTPSWDEVALDRPALAAAGLALLLAVLARRVADSALLVLVAFGALVTVVLTVVTPLDGDDELLLTGALLVAAVGWLVLTELRPQADRMPARVLGTGLALLAAQVPTWQGDETRWLGYLLTAVVVVVLTVTYLRRGAWPYLAGAVLGVTVVVPEVVVDVTGGGLGAIGAVLLTGVTLLAASGLGAWLRSRRQA